MIEFGKIFKATSEQNTDDSNFNAEEFLEVNFSMYSLKTLWKNILKNW